MLAIHEAGHAVAYFRMFPGSYAKLVTIESDEDMDLAGYLWPAHDISVFEEGTPEAVADELIANRALVACAGYAACILFDWPDEEAASICYQDFEQAGDLKDYGTSAALELLRTNVNINAVTIIAEELMGKGTIDSEQVSILMDVADAKITMDDYREFLINREIARSE